MCRMLIIGFLVSYFSSSHNFFYLVVNCWPSVSGSDTYVIIEYEALSMFDLQNVVVSVPLPALRKAPNVTQIEGD